MEPCQVVGVIAHADGEVQGGRDYFLVDDFIGQGGTLANLLNAPRMLSASEIDLLRQSKQEIAERYEMTRTQAEMRSQTHGIA